MSSCPSPVSLLKVRGSYQVLGCELDQSNLMLAEPIGEDGSRSQVFAARYHEPETGISHAVAVKRFPPPRTQQELKSVHREIGVMYLASTRCHHCARCWGYTQGSDGALMLIMKQYKQSLNAKLRSIPDGRLPLSDVYRYGLQIARAGMELHSQNVVLADLKPANMLLDEFDNIAVADFGISTLLKHGEEQDEGLHGTFNYMSPEAFDPESGRLSTMSDIWSFACCILEMVTGQRPWSGTQMSAICFKITAAREIPEIPSYLPDSLRNLLLACFAYDSSARPTFADIHDSFSQQLGQSNVSCLEKGIAAVQGITENAELLRLRHEEARWNVQRKELVSRVRRDACLIADIQKNAVEHQEVNEKLQEQLVLLVKSLKEQRQRSLPNNALPSDSAGLRYVEQLQMQELQLAGCQDALKYCMRQKDVAKQMLRQESARTRHLTEEVQKLHDQQVQIQDVVLQLALQTKIAEDDIKRIYEDAAGEEIKLSRARHPDRMTRVRLAHKSSTHSHYPPLLGVPVTRGLYGSDSHKSDSTEMDSTRNSLESSSSTEIPSNLDLPRRAIGAKYNSFTGMSPTVLSQAGTPPLQSIDGSACAPCSGGTYIPMPSHQLT